MHILTTMMSTSNDTYLKYLTEHAVRLAERKKALVESKELLAKPETEFKKKLWLCDDTYWETIDKLFTTEDELLKINKNLNKTEEELLDTKKKLDNAELYLGK